MFCRGKVHLDLPIVTAADPLALTNIECLVLDAPEEGLLLGRVTLQSIGVDLDGIFEQLHVVEADAQADDIPVLDSSAENDVVDVLHRLVDEAMEAGFDMHSTDRLRDLVVSYSDVFRLRLGHDEPADVDPLEVRLVPDAQPYRSGVRRYPEVQRQFLRDYVREFEPAGLVERNNHSRWSCPALPVAKQGTNEFWITIDYRPVTKPLAGAAPNLAVVVEAVRGAFVTEDGVYTPTRVPQWVSDSVVHFQAQMNDVLKEVLFRSVLTMCYSLPRHRDSYLDNLEKFFSILRQRRLELNAKKCNLFPKRVKWCGMLIDGEGVEYVSARLVVLRKMPLPPTGAALQHFLCALNWLRDSMMLEKVMRERERRKPPLSGATVEWSADEQVAFRRILAMVADFFKLFFLDKGISSHYLRTLGRCFAFLCGG
ncbi:LOW QUALITY PROTEIN: hypothetical protein PHMEG_00020479 [Phytophthora megakarya]|uniref:Reverse transcriptase n=1 Tax=Phytophthora megakarya TaxID=4795 RepID=A0A225VPA0_9STRA|nr:LOW QUALITY PROTEIN: hypothetical protein PHMEG_00020479 [Phytophthora megakarya]